MSTGVAAAARSLRELAWEALGTVHDPELDEAVTGLGFVADLRVDGGSVEVDLRLPTYFCAPNFAYLMVADAHDALAAVPGLREVRVRLLDHFASDEINAGVAGGRGFAGSFPGLADDELAELRLTFWRKAHRACQEKVAAGLVRAGWAVDELARATLADAELASPGTGAGGADGGGGDVERLRRRRRSLGLPLDGAAPVLVSDCGRPIERADLATELRLARTTRVSIEGNSAFCRGLLSVRYGDAAGAAG